MKRYRIVESFDGKRSEFLIEEKGWFFWSSLGAWHKSLGEAETYLEEHLSSFSGRIVKEIEIETK